MPGNTLTRVLIGCLACVSAAVHAQYHERIVGFDADIEVRTDGSAIVSETITVYANSDQIQRGIFRDLPARRLHPTEVLRNGQSEDFHTRRSSVGTRIYIGSPDRYLEPGEHTYTIRYEWPRIVRHFESHDEVYWNVTGNQWAFPIESAEARIRLPEGVEPDRLVAEAYTGPEGTQGTDYEAAAPEPGVAHFETTAALYPNEGFTIVLSFPKGVVTPPTAVERAAEYAGQLLFVWGSLAAFLMVVIYYLTVWFIAGRDPAPGRILPIDHPPADHSPAACRYVRHMSFDGSAFSAAIVNMAYKGHLRIEQDDTAFVLVQETGSDQPLFPEEQAIAETLFAEKPELTVSRSENNETFMRARSRAAGALRADYANVYFKQNLWYLIPGLILSAMALYQTFPSRDRIDDFGLALFLNIFLGIWTIGVTFLVWLAFTSWQYARKTPEAGASGVVLMSVMAGLFGVAEIVLFIFAAAVSSFIFSCSVVFVAVVNSMFGYLLRRHTNLGRELLDRIESFEQWLTDAAVHPFSAASPEESAARYERFLPYVIAFDREDAWSSEFDHALSTAAAAPDAPRDYRPRWYRPRRDRAHATAVSVGAIMSSFTSSFNEAVNTASTAASSSSSSGSSGSGGGGSSGGGSGGGGGGGW